MEFSIRYHNHSGFSITVDDSFFMFDYFNGRLPKEAIKKAKKAFIFVSHGHQDHYSQKIFSLKEYNDNITYILSKGITTDHEAVYMLPDQKLIIGGLTIETFNSTDEGVCYLLTYKGVRIFHAGDLNLWSWRNNSEYYEILQAEKEYYRILNTMLRKVQDIDIAFFPVDPRMRGNYEEGAVKFLEAFKVTHFFPMHMWHKYKAAHALDKYNFKNTIIYKVSNKNKEFKIYIGDD